MNSEILNYCYNILSVKDHTECELIKKLSKKYKNENFDEILEHLKFYGYIDDEKYSVNYVLSKFRKGYGQYYIKHKLFEKGINISVEKIVGIISKEYNIDDKVKDVLIKKILSYKRFDVPKRKKKLFDFLLRRGFDADSIGRVIQEVFEYESNIS